ncbi:conserved hypothetical protein [Leishmania major strain Friedlin]|uniref:Uncharacterized protein n=1 Tax=Leishmania major TaxID=5664 RepID=Q4Q0Z0_LEIMA|nr:conserved hypothetical protein [Leishmania major strain Friedlin]CAG9583971.1 WD_domain_-_G-beta_repeat_-_putative [Leishmania major strain Friedlin]CAJ09391.1 conserved hypothetical protein [Leishmania major strain Friedlin]|eukprot:XP_001687008.1 conserved hypothetical protein [Leishmania major strain Friedlin]
MPSTAEQSLTPLFVLQEHTDPVLSCSFYPSEVYQRDESSWFLSGDAGGLVVLWDLSTRRKMISFSAVTEAHRQLCGISQHGRNRGTSTTGDLIPENEVLLERTGTLAFGPHSQSVLSVGFIPLSLSSPQPTAVTANSRGVADALVRGSDAEVSNSAVCSAVVDHATRGTSEWAHPGRPRFRLSRRAPTRSVSSEQASSLSTGDVPDSGAQGFAFTPSSTICFYTHCRDQRVYIWCLKRQCTDAPASSPPTRVPQLVVVLTAPQHGFCPVESISKAANPFTRTYLAVPHESGGEVTVWELSWRQPNSARLTSSRELEEKGASDGPRSSSGNASVYEEEEEEVNTSGMNPMDALIARAAAEERQQAKMKQKSTRVSGESDLDHPSPSAAFPDSVISRGERASILCYVDPAATTTSSNFSVRRLRTFSACPTFKGGMIMRLTMCHDAQHLTVAFESGHIVLARYRDADVIDMADEPGEVCHAGGSMSVARVRNVTRAFADSALACWWSGRRMLACSSEGGMHCYDVSATAEGLLEAHLVWSVTLRKGIGSVFLQRNLVVAGCWDSTLRLYDARDGRLVSILSYQRETINEVRAAPPSIARVAAFGFDVRQPRLYAGQPGALSTKIPACIASNSKAVTQGNLPQFSESPLRETYVAGTPTPHSSSGSLAAEEQLVYLFASASKACTVALWRVDLGLVVEQTAREAIAAQTV